jgi:hypothetical protein
MYFTEPALKNIHDFVPHGNRLWFRGVLVIHEIRLGITNFDWSLFACISFKVSNKSKFRPNELAATYTLVASAD